MKITLYIDETEIWPTYERSAAFGAQRTEIPRKLWVDYITTKRKFLQLNKKIDKLYEKAMVMGDE